MARVISGLRVARSFLTPTGATNVLTRELDFQLAANTGISIRAVLGFGTFRDASPTPSDTVVNIGLGQQTLHLETGATEDAPIDAGDDEDDIDTEIFYVQMFASIFQVPNTAGGGGGYGLVTPNGLVTFDEPIETARNITHRAETVSADTFLHAGMLIYYKYVKFSDQELGFILARRQ